MKGLKSKLRSGKPVIGLFLASGCTAAAEIAAGCGYDFVIVRKKLKISTPASKKAWASRSRISVCQNSRGNIGSPFLKKVGAPR